MGLFINGVEYDIFDSDGTLLNLEIDPFNPITNNIRILTLDDYILKDLNGVYITSEEEE